MEHPRIIPDKHEQWLKGQKRRLWKARLFTIYVLTIHSLFILGAFVTLVVQIWKLIQQWK